MQNDGGLVGGPKMCPNGQLAVEIGNDGSVRCAAPDAEIKTAIDASCGIYYGWRDNCDGCTTPPTKFGRAGATCTQSGTDTTCTMPSLLGTTVTLFGLNLDGNVGTDDKLYGSFHCALPTVTPSNSPCAAGQFVVGRSGSSWTCAPLAEAAATYARESCSLYMGWQDQCNGCTTAPTKWGRSSTTGCQNGTGSDNTCSTVTVGTETVNVFGLNLDGDVGEDDKFHFGLHCDPPPAPSGTPTTRCPPGQFVTSTNTDGSFACGSPVAAVHTYITQRCTLYAGHRDGCDGCMLAPAKWGSAKVGSCTLGPGTDNTCTRFTLGTTMVDLLGINTDGDVDGNDTFYVGLKCQ